MGIAHVTMQQVTYLEVAFPTRFAHPPKQNSLDSAIAQSAVHHRLAFRLSNAFVNVEGERKHKYAHCDRVERRLTR